jgi:formate hydrogenlyase subunit 4
MNYFPYITVIVQLLFVPALAPFIIGWIRKIKARLQNREGASVFQPYRDLWKLFQKDEAVSEDASWIFFFAPRIVFAVTLVAGAMIPIIVGSTLLGSLGDFIVLIYLIALGTFFLALGGLDVGNAFGDMGGSREMTLAAVTEGGLFFALLPVAILAGSSNMSAMLMHTQTASGAGVIALLIAGCAFFIALLSENARYPFDNPSTHLELTMVHEAMIIEHSGKSLGLMEWAAANKLMLFLVLFVNMFFPWGIVVPDDIGSLFFQLGFLSVKVLIAAAFIALLESTTPKLRFFKLPELLFTSFALGIIALVIVLVTL